MGVVDPANVHNKDDQNPQLEGSAESSNPLPTGGGDHTEVAADVIKRCRFKRRALKCIIERYIYATKELIEQKGSRATIKQNLSDIVETFKKIEGFHAQLEEHSQDEEELLDDMMALTDIRLEVNNITGMVQEHLEKKASGSSHLGKSQASSKPSSSPPSTPEEYVEDQEELDKDKKKQEINEQRLQQAARLSELVLEKRAEAAQLQEQADEAERQSEAIGGRSNKSSRKLPANLLTQTEIGGEEKARLYVKHLEQIQPHGAQAENDNEEDWIVEFRKTLKVSVRAVDPGKIPVRADVPVYNGDPLKWLSWGGLFKALVHDTKMTSEAKMGFLHTKLSKECDRVIAGLFPDDEGYAEALMLLRDRYGHPTTLQAAHLLMLKSLPDVSSGNPDSVATSFQSFVDQARSHLSVLKRYSKGESPFVSSLIYDLTDKLPQEDAKAWRTKVGEGQVRMTLEAFSTWLGARGRCYWSALPPQNVRRKENRNNRNLPRRSLIGQYGAKCPKCEGKHKTESCIKFKELSAEERLNFAKEKRLCFSCLEGSHVSRNCPQKKECSIGNCKKKHHSLLYEEENVRATTTKTPRSGVAFGVVEVSVVGAGGIQVKGNLLFDDGSDTTLVSESFVRKLGLRGKKTTLNISGVGGNERKRASSQVTLRVKTPGGDAEYANLTAWSLPKICQPVETVPWPEIKTKWKHLENLNLKAVGGEIDILLGLDHADLLVPLDVRMGKPQEPVGKRTSFGWMAVGLIGNPRRSIHSFHVARAESEQLDVAFKQFWDSESFGTKTTNAPHYSNDEQRAIDILEHETKKLESGYEVPLLWKENEPQLQNNREVAKKRLEGLQRRFEREPEYEKNYRKAISKYIEDGYAHKVSQEDDLNGPNQWYLPHHGVYKKSSTEKKIRVVFDASAKHRGKCLNDALLAGPVLQNELPQVLTKFRQGDVAFGADIEAMFSRIRLQKQDARYHRFLWKEKDSDVINTYQMDRLAFGDTSSPCEAIYVTRRAAKDFGQGQEEAVRAINENLYVDDYLDSTETTEQAITKGRQVKEILANGDLHLKKWTSNVPEVASALGEEKKPEVDVVTNLVEHEPEKKILGVKWNTETDELTFAVVPVEHVTYTRRGLLSKLAGVFDPLGLASPFIIKAKILTQQLCLLGLDWDDPIPNSHLTKWNAWLHKLPELEKVSVPRCIQPKKRNVTQSELHTFCDASEEAFAAVVYLRSIYDDDDIRCSFLMAKTKVAPKRALSVARLELQAAVLGARLADYVRKAMTRHIDRVFFWTDSKCVIGWIRSTAVWYKPFVAHRVGEIQTLTDPKSWRHVPGRVNVSDCATRSRLDERSELIPVRWFTGPDFLYQDEENWPKEIPVEDLQQHEEIKPSKIFVAKSNPERAPVHADVDLERISSLWKAQRVAAQVHRFFSICKGKKPGSSVLTVEELRVGLTALVRQCQREAFPSDLESLERTKTVSKRSKLLSFTPYLDESNVIRVEGRLDRAQLPYEVRHPILLPQKHRLTELIVESYHRLENHGGIDHVLAAIRQKFWIIRGRQEVKSFKRKCTKCKKERAKPSSQLLSELPSERITAMQPAFYHTSVDYFGPIEVKLTRNTTTKRYGALFTCMSTRCVHLEVAESLSTPDFLQVLHKMMARRGEPRSIYSDNGTNFVGAVSELKSMIRELNRSEELKNRLARIGEGINWKFQPPASPHWGGVHESLVKSVKIALNRTLNPKGGQKRRNLTDMQLSALFAEVERFVNSRPITYVSSDPQDIEALTPYHFWLHRRSPVIPLGEYSRPNFQDRFKQTQHLANVVWQQWVKPYLPSLISRKKWRNEERNISVNDVVLVAVPGLLRGEWKLGRVVEAYPGKDGRVRAAKVKTNNGFYTRPVTKLYILEEDGGYDRRLDEIETNDGEE